MYMAALVSCPESFWFRCDSIRNLCGHDGVCVYVCVYVYGCAGVCVCVCMYVCDGKLVNTISQEPYIGFMSYLVQR